MFVGQSGIDMPRLPNMSLGDAGKATLRAAAHPVRLRIMSLLTGAPLTAAEVARELGLTHANASYHLRTLASAGMIVAAGEEKIRGGVAKRYRDEPAHDIAGEKDRGPRPDAYFHDQADVGADAPSLDRHAGQPGRTAAASSAPGAGPYAHGRIAGVTIPNVLAARYASADLVTIWSPEEKIRMERRLWLA